MSLLDDIKGQLGSEAVGKIGSMLGLNGQQAQSAVNAAVPSMLSGVIDLAKNQAGAEKLGSALKGIDLSALSNPSQALGGGGLGDIGGKLLGGLFGQGAMGGLGDIIGKFAGISGGGIGGKLIGMIAPFILGSIAKKWLGSGGTPQGLTSMLNAEKGAVQAAMPAGLSLGNVFGLTGNVSAPSMPSMPQPEGGGLLKLLIPLVLLALLAAGAYWYMNKDNKPEENKTTTNPSTSQQQEKRGNNDPQMLEQKTIGEVTGMFTELGTTLDEVKGVDGLDKIAPKIKEMQTKADGWKEVIGKLGGPAKTALVEKLKEGIKKIKEVVAKITALPGVGDKIKPVNSLIETLEGYTK